ncbi:hypothetical protein LAKU_13c00340 [Apilactobacillus kunkeei EFB6]|uniref:Uncharacterized protein n=1 Tax=Apilactobacillus kunkeei EFB6 TaxID=1419324 RepID=A0A837B083_9LACO|nr:hypothetical protein [Apilactobacillus kunkeei]KDB00838.1 hypothetical protein LAKU_13c00340 [Apilactobacillus kunkeei EFB6]CAI2555558.1 hypothetical protein AKUH3B203M01_00320 [Apilactobacillus kunkeei]CAI2555878.1 hypothetical protein AKUH3B203M_01150 [Apilactobacillus kunkeei]CAI2801035.1 hypothetical protein AKUH3B203M04_05970 [Apilactobacillus kunkeei]
MTESEIINEIEKVKTTPGMIDFLRQLLKDCRKEDPTDVHTFHNFEKALYDYENHQYK